MKILYILPWVPYPLDSGGNQAFFNMLNAIRQVNDVTLITYTHSSRERDAAAELRKVWPNVTIECYADIDSSIPYGVTMSKPDELKSQFYSYLERSMQRKKKRMLRKYVFEQNVDNGKTDFSLGQFVRENSTLYHVTADLNEGFLEYVYNKSREGYDMVQVEFFEYLPLIYVLPENVKRVFVHHELRFIRNENEMSLYNECSVHDKILLQRQKDEELSMLAHYDNIIVLTEVDKKILEQYIPSERLYVSPALTSASEMAGKYSFSPATDLVFVGGGAHFPNADGILWFAQKVMPELKKLGFDAKVNVVGKWNESIQVLVHNLSPDIKFVGFVDDLGSFLNGRITIVPIRIGSGMRMKIIDAMAANSPMVTTAKGCEGLPLVDGEDCFIADDPVVFAKSIVRLQHDTDLQNRLVERTSVKMQSILDADELLKTRLEFYK